MAEGFSLGELESTVEEATPRFLPYLAIISVGFILIAAVPWFS
jgi:hypothetical protein